MENILGIGQRNLEIALGTFACLLVLHIITRGKRIPRGLRLPPGPPGKFFFGNAADMPTQYGWETFSQWAKEYGDLVYIKVFGTHMVIVNSAEVADDLFEKRSLIYSDRLDAPMLNDLVGFNWAFSLMHYGEQWRRHRKAFHAGFQPTAIAAYHDVEIRQTRSILRRLHETPHNFNNLLRHLAGAIIMETVYGIKVLPESDPYIELAEKAAAALGEAVKPGRFLVDTFPILKYIPEWMPGAGFQTKARVWRATLTEVLITPFAVVKNSLASGTATSSVLARLLEELATRLDAPPDEEDIIRNVAGIAYLGGADTIVSATNAFVLAMVLYPKVQRKAQAELDSVLGTDCLPVFEDREHLPYIDALCKEVLRWHPVSPLGLAHGLRQDDVYGKYFIPKGSIVIGNTWNILHDGTMYGPDHEAFRPERFLRPGVRDPTAAFGYGRRICPGRNMAINSLWIVAASILKVFDISHARDSSGKEIPVHDSFTSGFLSHPMPFQCSIKPRSETAEHLIFERDDN